MYNKILRTLGFATISISTFFQPVTAYADSGSSNGAVGGVIGALLGGLITGAVLVSMSRTKHHATKADKYVNSDLDLMRQYDNYVRTTTDKRKIRND